MKGPRQGHVGEPAREVWRAIRDAGSSGIGTDHLRLVVPGLREMRILKGQLGSLRRGHYAAFDGCRRVGVWRISTNVPPGESLMPGEPGPVAIMKLHPGKPPRPGAPSPLAPAVLVLTVPASVWALGSLSMGQTP